MLDFVKFAAESKSFYATTESGTIRTMCTSGVGFHLVAREIKLHFPATYGSQLYKLAKEAYVTPNTPLGVAHMAMELFAFASAPKGHPYGHWGGVIDTPLERWYSRPTKTEEIAAGLLNMAHGESKKWD